MPGLIIFLGLGLLLAWMGGVWAVHRALTRPPRRTYASAVARGRAGDPGELTPARRFESWTFRSRGLDLPVWDIAGDDPAGPIVVMSHGWGDSRIGVLQRLPLVVGMASRVVAWDMPGHGEAPGTSTLGAGEVDDLLALIGHLREPTRSMVLLGWSLGAGVSIAAAVRLGRGPETGAGASIVGVIAEAPYRVPRTPALRMLHAMGWPSLGTLRAALLLASRRAPVLRRADVFDRAALAAALPCPLLVLHGEGDEICPVADGREIHASALGVQPGSRIEVFEGAYHNDLWQNEHRLARGEAAVRVFLQET